MRRFLIAIAIVSSLFLAMPLHARAANLPPSILPKCDETKYVIQSKSGSPVGPLGPLPAGGTVTISPEEFNVAPYLKADWEVVDYKLTENCSFNDMLQLFVNLFNWGLYVLSILALFFFFLGGGTLLLSGGNEERVRTGKAILGNTVIGVGIALSSWIIVNLTVNTLLPEDSVYHKNGIGALVANQPWFRVGASSDYDRCGDPPEYPCKESAIVRQVQEDLWNLQCYSNPGTRTEEVDGSFGPKTLEAWHAWQRANGATETNVLSGFEEFKFPCFDPDTPV